MFEPFLNIQPAPLELNLLASAISFELACKLDHPLSGVWAAIKNNILDSLAQRWVEVFIDTKLARIDDSHR